MPPWSENRRRQSLSRSNHSLRFRHRPYAFDTSSVVPLRSSSCQSPDLVLPRPFPSVLTTMAFDHSRRRWFGTCSCQPVPRGPPSSIRQLHTLGPPRPFALVAHGHPHNGPSSLPSPPAPSTNRAGANRCWITMARSLPLVGSRLPSLPESLRASLRPSTTAESAAARAGPGPAVAPA